MKIEFSEQIFEKYSFIKFHGITSNGSQVVPCRQTYMTKAKSLFIIFRKRMKSVGYIIATKLWIYWYTINSLVKVNLVKFILER